MAAPLTFAIEFGTDAARRELQSLVSTVKAHTVDIAANVLAPISPATLVTQIAQQGLGVNSLANNLVAGGLGAARGSSAFGSWVKTGEMFNAENAAINQTIAEARAARAGGLPMTDGQMDLAYQLNYQSALAQEREEGRFRERKAASIAQSDIGKTLANGTQSAIRAAPYLAGALQYVPDFQPRSILGAVPYAMGGMGFQFQSLNDLRFLGSLMR